MVFLSNLQVRHMLATWLEQPMDGHYLGKASNQISWPSASLFVTLLIAFTFYLREISESKCKKALNIIKT